MKEFVHLHLHSQYSLLDGAIRFEELFPLVRTYGMKSLALIVFRMRTEPLLEYYHKLGVPLLPLDIGVKTTAQEMRLQLDAKWSQIMR